MEWTTPADIRMQVERYWNNGVLLSARLTGETVFPLRIPLRKPGPQALAERFADVRQWIRQLEEGSKSGRGYGYEIDWTNVNHRQLGRNRIPARLSIASERDALALIGRTREADQFQKLAGEILECFPELRAWLVARSLTVLEHGDAWHRILSVLAWFRENPCSSRYVRQIDIPGVDTKFIETRMTLLTDLFGALEPGGSHSSRELTFEQRFGLRSKQPLVRFRLLDENLYIGGLSDLAIPAPDFARLAPGARCVFITENETNGLAFPNVAGGLVIFGLGYGLERLGEAPWLRDRPVYYWGDIDTHGFAMLDRLRAFLPHSESLLMDPETLLSHRHFWVTEDQPHLKPLGRLAPAELTLYDDLRYDRLGDRVRLEQERISFSILEKKLRCCSARA
jgi:hypothetical protein